MTEPAADLEILDRLMVFDNDSLQEYYHGPAFICTDISKTVALITGFFKSDLAERPIPFQEANVRKEFVTSESDAIIEGIE